MIGLGARCVAAVGADVRQLRFVQMQRPEAATADGVEQCLEPRFGSHTIPGPIHRQRYLIGSAVHTAEMLHTREARSNRWLRRLVLFLEREDRFKNNYRLTVM